MKFTTNLEFTKEELETLAKARDIILHTGKINWKNLAPGVCPLGEGSELSCDDIPMVRICTQGGTICGNDVNIYDLNLFDLWNTLDELVYATSLIIIDD